MSRLVFSCLGGTDGTALVTHVISRFSRFQHIQFFADRRPLDNREGGDASHHIIPSTRAPRAPSPRCMLHSSCFDRKSLSFRSSFTPLGDLNESDLRAGGYILIFCHRRPAEERATAVLPSYHTPQPTNNSNNRQTTATTVVEDAQGPTGLTQTAAVSGGRAFISQDVNKTTAERIGDRGRSPAVQRTSRATSISSGGPRERPSGRNHGRRKRARRRSTQQSQ